VAVTRDEAYSRAVIEALIGGAFSMPVASSY